MPFKPRGCFGQNRYGSSLSRDRTDLLKTNYLLEGKMAELLPLGYQSGMYDSAFLGILQHSVKLPPFLDAFFSFLARRTDFYVILKEDNPKMGFLPGVAEDMVHTVRTTN